MSSKTPPLRYAVTAMGLLITASALCAERPTLTVHHVGEYAAIPWQEPGAPIEPGSRADRVRDLNLSVASVNLKDDMPEAFYEGWNTQIKLAAATGNVLLPRLHFWDGEDVPFYDQMTITATIGVRFKPGTASETEE